MQKVILVLHNIRPLSPKLKKHLRSILRRYEFKKGEIIQKAGTEATQILFIESGLIGSYTRIKYSGNKRKNVFNWFMKERDIFISVLSFFRQLPSTDNIVALEDSVCWGITREELWETFMRFPEFLWHGFLICSDYYCRSYERLENKLRLKPHEIYQFMLQKENELLAAVPIINMASYLGVSRSTYAKIRSDMAKGKRPKARKKSSPKSDIRKRAIGRKKVSR